MSSRNNRLIILGAPRSGTTLLRRLLNGHPEISCPPETYLFTAAARFLKSEPIADGGRLGVVPGLGHAGFSPEEVRRRFRAFIFGFHEELAAQQGKSRWAEKTAVDVFHLEKIEELCGEHVTYVGLLRHGLDVAVSMKELSDRSGSYLSELHTYIGRYPRPMEAFCHAWVEACERILELDGRSQQSVLLRYEDLVADPDREMTRIMDFIGAKWDPELSATALQQKSDVGLGDWKTYATSGVSAKSVGRGRELPKLVQSELGAILNPTLERCGYEPISQAKAPSEKEAQRRYQMALRLGALKHQEES